MGAKDFCPDFPNLARKTSGPLFVRTFLKQNFFRDDLQKKRSSYDSADVVHHFSKTNHVGRHFCPDIEDFRCFAQISMDFARISMDFARIFTKLKLLGVRLQPLHPHLLHH